MLLCRSYKYPTCLKVYWDTSLRDKRECAAEVTHSTVPVWVNESVYIRNCWALLGGDWTGSNVSQSGRSTPGFNTVPFFHHIFNTSSHYWCIFQTELAWSLGRVGWLLLAADLGGQVLGQQIVSFVTYFCYILFPGIEIYPLSHLLLHVLKNWFVFRGFVPWHISINMSFAINKMERAIPIHTAIRNLCPWLESVASIWKYIIDKGTCHSHLAMSLELIFFPAQLTALWNSALWRAS